MSIVDRLHEFETELGRITFEVTEGRVRLSLFEVRSLNRIKDQIDDLLAVDKLSLPK